MELTRKGLGGGVGLGFTLAEFVLLSLQHRARGQPLQVRQQQSRIKKARAERAGTRM